MKRALLLIAATATSSAYAGQLIPLAVPALDEVALIGLALGVGVVGARALQRIRSRRKTQD